MTHHVAVIIQSYFTPERLELIREHLKIILGDGSTYDSLWDCTLFNGSINDGNNPDYKKYHQTWSVEDFILIAIALHDAINLNKGNRLQQDLFKIMLPDPLYQAIQYLDTNALTYSQPSDEPVDTSDEID